MPKGKKHTPEQIVAILRRIDQGQTADRVCREANISAATLYRWKRQFGNMKPEDVKELKVLRDENARLKRLVADQALNIVVLQEVNAKKW
jgi:putative transposase